jgi:hypothetical protein
MSNNKQQTAVDIIYQGMSDKIVMQDVNKALICIHISHDDFIKLHRQAKEMEKGKHEKFNKFLNDEKQLGISDLKTIERIQWYYNTYFNETYGGNND